MKKQDLIKEEQDILDELIACMDREIKDKTKELKEYIKEAVYFSGANTDVLATYGIGEAWLKDMKKKLKQQQQARDELYKYRIKVRVQDEDGGDEEEEIKIGLHTFCDDGKIYVNSWVTPGVCRYYVFNDSEVYDFCNTLKHGEKYHVKYTLQMKREINLHFTRVKQVIQKYPILTEEEEKAIYDEFLLSLLKRRSNAEFENIVFSIQKQQGEIIQAPFRRDMIVQGCAGSGKSMIMLHRLPIILVDNQESLARNNLYIITPSQAYIQMADKMMRQLEIDDLKMGTAEQYYEYCIRKYGHIVQDIGKKDSSYELSHQKEIMLYSSEGKTKLKQCIDDTIEEFMMNLGDERALLDIEPGRNYAGFAYEKLNNFLFFLQKVIDKNNLNLKQYFNQIIDIQKELNYFSILLMQRKNEILRFYQREETKQKDIIEKANKEIERLDPEINDIAIRNRKKQIEDAEKEINEIIAKRTEVYAEKEYFERLNRIAESLDQAKKTIPELDREYRRNSMDTIYDSMDHSRNLMNQYYYIYNELLNTEDPYSMILEPIADHTNKAALLMQQYAKLKVPVLQRSKYLELLKRKSEIGDPVSEVPVKIYRKFMKQMELPDQARISCTAYVYLQLLFLYRGSPNASIESLITIDEAQSMAVEELQLISRLNQGRVIFNLFGDEKQHIEGTKGVDSWAEYEDITDFKQYNMDANYRNARQITDYCNRKFGLKMRAINLDGAGVHELTTEQKFKDTMKKQFQSAKNGTCAILVKNRAEAQYIMNEFQSYSKRLVNLTDDESDMNYSKWNLMTVEEAKGLEFTSVCVISGRMSENEKYISYTRALDELFVYEGVINLPEQIKEDEPTEFVPGERGKKQNRNFRNKSDEIIDFFKKKDLKVIDSRSKTGEIWVVGSKRKNDKIIQEACVKFNIKGSYAFSDMTDYKPGWKVEVGKV